MPGYVFHRVRAELADVVEAIWHADFPGADGARSMVLPVVSPILCFHYRSAPLLRMGGPGAERLVDPGGYRITGISSASARIQANGPVGGVMVRLRPEGAARLRGVSLPEFAEGAAALGDVFSDGDVSLLEERLLESVDAEARVQAVQQFLLGRLSEREPDTLACAAAMALRSDPSVTVRSLARRLDVGERHLSRRFLASFGTSPKRFARIVRFGAAVRAGRRIGWADTAVPAASATRRTWSTSSPPWWAWRPTRCSVRPRLACRARRGCLPQSPISSIRSSPSVLNPLEPDEPARRGRFGCCLAFP